MPIRWDKLTVKAQEALPATIGFEVLRDIERLPKVSGGSMTQASMSPALNRVLEQVFKEADNFKDEYVSTEHLLLAMGFADPRLRAGTRGYSYPHPPWRNLRCDPESADCGARFAEGYRQNPEANELRCSAAEAGYPAAHPGSAGAQDSGR
jgi:Clp amino terminal domain, pathogenicity island component